MAYLFSTCPLCGLAAARARLCAACSACLAAQQQAAGRRCGRCWLAIPAGQPCPQCAALLPAWDRVVAAFDYVEPADLLIHRLKSRHELHLVPVLGHLLAQAALACGWVAPPGAILVPVPSSRRALVRRGFNPAAELARDLSRRLGLPCRPAVLQRLHEGRRQAMLGRQDRMAAVARLYQVSQKLGAVPLVVVDDVMTSGATLHAIARQLRQAGASSVTGLVVARTPLGGRD